MLSRLFCGIAIALLLGAAGRPASLISAETKLSPFPTNIEVLAGEAFTVEITVSNVSRLAAWQVALKYNGTVANCTSVWIPENNVFQGRAFVSLPSVLNKRTVDGYNCTIFGSSLYAESVDVSEGLLFRMNFTAKARGMTQLQIATRENPARSGTRPSETHYSILLDADGQELQFATEEGNIEVGPRQTLTLTTSQGGTSDPPPGTYEYPYGQNVTVTAISDAHYILECWVLDGSRDGTSSSITFLMTENHTLYAVFVRAANFTLTLSANPGCTTDPPPGKHTFPAGEIVQVFAAADESHRFDHWILDGSSEVASNPISILMDHNCTLEAILSDVSYIRTIYIRPEGNVDPQDVPIQAFDDFSFAFTGTITDSIIVVQRSNIVIDGNGYALEGGGSGEGFSLYSVSNVTIKNVNIRGFDRGICLFGSSLNLISGNSITSNRWIGIALYNSSNNTIRGNNLTANNDAGIRLEYSSNWNMITENNVAGNKWLGIYIDSSVNNSILHNNWENNTNQAYVADSSSLSANSWDDGSEGNYWSDYVSLDSNNDGIADVPFVIDENNADHYPLTGKTRRFNASADIVVDIVSNSTITNFHYSEATRKITFNVTGTDGTIGFCRIKAEDKLINMNHVRILIDDGRTPLLYVNHSLYDNATHRWIYFAYEQSTHAVEILEDLTPPAVSLLSPRNMIYSVDNVLLVFALNESAVWSGYSLDGGANVTADANTTLTSLADGPHNVVVYADDAAGNTGSSGLTLFTVDTIPPNITAIRQDPDIDNVSPEDLVEVNATVRDDTTGVKRATLTYTCHYNSDTWNDTLEMTNVEGNIWNATLPAFPYGASIAYTITAEDNAGHAATTLPENQYQVIPESTTAIALCLMIASLSAIAMSRRLKKGCAKGRSKSGPGEI